eukprot:scaffold20053_cov117-Cylindrotheca_fusiformis.AAC.2
MENEIQDDTTSSNSRMGDRDYAASLVVRQFDQRSIPKNGKKRESRDDSDPLNDQKVRKEASFELPIEYTGNGFKLLRDAEVSVYTTMPPSRVGGPWSGVMEGRSKLGPSGESASASGSVTLDYKSSPWSKLSIGMIRGQELYHPLITLGGTLIRGGSSIGVAFYHNATFLQAMLLEHSMYSLSFRHNFPRSQWTLTSMLSRRQVLSVSMSNTKLAGSMGLNLRKPTDLEVRVDARPRLSERRRAYFFGSLRPGAWQVGASVRQYLHSEVASVGMGARIYSIRGLEWVLSWNRGDASINIPILISRGIHSAGLIQTVFFSIISYFIQEGIAEIWGWKAVQEGQNPEAKSLANIENAAKGREDAELQQGLMSRQANRRRREEIEKDGLVIQQATYQIKGGDAWNVTIPLQFWVSKSSLTLPATSKRQLLGFYDVAAGLKEDDNSNLSSSSSMWHEIWHDLWNVSAESDSTAAATNTPMITLEVEYSFMGQSYSITISDKEELQLPNPRANRLLNDKK